MNEAQKPGKLEQRLKSLPLSPTGLNRDRLVFAAGAGQTARQILLLRTGLGLSLAFTAAALAASVWLASPNRNDPFTRLAAAKATGTPGASLGETADEQVTGTESHSPSIRPASGPEPTGAPTGANSEATRYHLSFLYEDAGRDATTTTRLDREPAREASSDGSTMGGDHPANEPLENNSSWIPGIHHILNTKTRIHGFWVNFTDVLFYRGSPEQLFVMLTELQKLENIELQVVIRIGQGIAASPWSKEPVGQADWSVTLTTVNPQVRVDLWPSGQLSLENLKLPPGLKLAAGDEGTRFIREYEKRHAGPAETERNR